MGVIIPNNECNIYSTKYNHLSKFCFFPRLMLRLDPLTITQESPVYQTSSNLFLWGARQLCISIEQPMIKKFVEW